MRPSYCDPKGSSFRREPGLEWDYRSVCLIRPQASAGRHASSVHIKCVEGLARRHEEPVELGASEAQIGAALGQPDAADGRAFRIEHEHAVQRVAPHAPAAPEIAVDVAANAIRRAAGTSVDEEPLVLQAAAIHVEGEDLPRRHRAGFDEVENRLIGRKAKAVRPEHALRHDIEATRAGVEPVDVLRQLGFGPVALVVAGDTEDGIGEPHGPIRGHDHVVGRVQPLPLMRRQPAVVTVPLSSVRDTRRPPCSQETKPTLPVARVAIGIAGRRAEHADCAARLVPLQDPVVGNVAPQKVPGVTEPDRPLGPACAGPQPLHGGAENAVPIEARVQALDPRIGIALGRLPHGLSPGQVSPGGVDGMGDRVEGGLDSCTVHVPKLASISAKGATGRCWRTTTSPRSERTIPFSVSSERNYATISHERRMKMDLLNAPTRLSDSAVVGKAVLRAAEKLGVSAKTLARVIGVSEPTLSRIKSGASSIERGTKPFELAVLFIRLFRSLDAIAGGDERVAKAWMINPNTAIGAPPVDRITTIPGLMDVIAYLDARRLSSEARAYQGTCWRLVEAQHIVSTLKLTDSLEEQDLLERLLEESKPLIPAECQHLDYLLGDPVSLRGRLSARLALPPGGPNRRRLFRGRTGRHCRCRTGVLSPAVLRRIPGHALAHRRRRVHGVLGIALDDTIRRSHRPALESGPGILGRSSGLLGLSGPRGNGPAGWHFRHSLPVGPGPSRWLQCRCSGLCSLCKPGTRRPANVAHQARTGRRPGDM